MRGWVCAAIIVPLVDATIRAWGRRWLTDAQAGAIITALLRFGLVGKRRADGGA